MVNAFICHLIILIMAIIKIYESSWKEGTAELGKLIKRQTY